MTAQLGAAPDVTVLTGAAGWFGRAFLEGTSGAGVAARDGEVRVLVGSPGDVPVVLASRPDAQVHVGDVRDDAVLDRLLDGTRGASVVHAAGVIHPARVSDLDSVNVGGTAAVLRAAGRHGAARVVHVSSNSPFGFNAGPQDEFRHDEPYQPWLGYGWSKLRAELLVREAHDRGVVPTVVVRPPWFYGPHQPLRQTTFFTLVRRGLFPLVGDGRQRRSMVHVENLVQGVARAERVEAAAGGAFWVADRRAYELNEVIGTVRRALEEEGVPVVRQKVRLPALAGRVAQRVDSALQARGRYVEKVHVLGEVGETIACSIERTTEVLGYEPTTDLLPGMRQAVRWCLDQGIEL